MCQLRPMSARDGVDRWCRQVTRRRLVLADPVAGYRHRLALRRLVSVGAKSSVATAAEMEGHLAPGRLVLAVRAVDLTLQIEDAAHLRYRCRRPHARPRFIAVNAELVASTRPTSRRALPMNSAGGGSEIISCITASPCQRSAPIWCAERSLKGRIVVVGMRDGTDTRITARPGASKPSPP